MNYLSDELRDLLDEASMFDVLASMQGEVFRQIATRRTFRFEHAGRGYFAKVHYGVGWREIVKNLLQLRLPVLGAGNEWRAIARLEHIGVDTLTPVAYSEHGLNPATRRSCIVTRELPDTITLEDLAAAGPVPIALKRRLIARVASIAARMHRHGVNHRDLYICHFHLVRGTQDAAEPKIHVIDLHRAQVRGRTPRRWIIKDVAGLMFSAFDAGLTRADLFRFMRVYSGKSVRQTLAQDRLFWRQVMARARRLYLRETGRAHQDRWAW